MTKVLAIYSICIYCLFVTIVPILRFLSMGTISLSSDFSVPIIMSKFVFYPLLGYYFEHKIEHKFYNLKNLLLLMVGAVLGITIEVSITYFEGIRNGGFNQNYVQVFDYIIAFTMFVGSKMLFEKYHASEKVEKIITNVGAVTFGVYLLDPLFRKAFGGIIMNQILACIPPIISSFIYCIISMVVCGSIVFILRKNKMIRKII